MLGWTFVSMQCVAMGGKVQAHFPVSLERQKTRVEPKMQKPQSMSYLVTKT